MASCEESIEFVRMLLLVAALSHKGKILCFRRLNALSPMLVRAAVTTAAAVIACLEAEYRIRVRQCWAAREWEQVGSRAERAQRTLLTQ